MSPVNIAGRVSRRKAGAGESKAVSSDVGEGEAREINVTLRRKSSQDSLSSLRRVDGPPELRRSIGDWQSWRKANCRWRSMVRCAYAVLLPETISAVPAWGFRVAEHCSVILLATDD